MKTIEEYAVRSVTHINVGVHDAGKEPIFTHGITNCVILCHVVFTS